MKKHIPKLITFGLGGDVVECTGGCHCSGYGTPERPHAANYAETPDGTPVIDKRPAVERHPGFAYASPLVNVDLPDGEVSRLPEPEPLMAAAMAGNQFGTLLAVHREHQQVSDAPGPLDYVPVREYVAWWQARGARIGRIEGGKLVWNDEQA